MKDYKRSFVSNNILVTLGHVLVYAKGIILLPILVKSMGVTFYGNYVLLMTGLGFISGISTFGVGFKFKRFMPSAQTVTEQRNLFYPPLFFQLLSIFVISVLLIISNSFIKTTIFKGQLDFSMYLVAGVLVCYVLYSISADFFRYTHRMNYFTIATTSQSYLTILFIIIAVYVFHKKTLNFLLLAYLSTLVLIAAPLLIKIYNEVKFRLPTFDIRNLLEDIRLGFPLTLSYVVDFILSGSDRYVIALFMSARAVGYYSPAYALGSLIILFPKVFGVVLPPLLSQAIDTGRDNEAKTLLNYSIKFFLLIAIPFIVGSYVLSKPLLELLANKEVADAAYLATPIIAMGILFYGLNLILTNVLFVRLKTKTMFGVNALSAILNLLLNIIFVYIFRNVLVAAITTLVSYLVSFVILNLKIKKHFVADYNLPVVLKCLIASVGMGIGLHYVKSALGTSTSIMLISILIALIAYIVLLLAFRTFSAKELSFARAYLAGIIRR